VRLSRGTTCGTYLFTTVFSNEPSSTEVALHIAADVAVAGTMDAMSVNFLSDPSKLFGSYRR